MSEFKKRFQRWMNGEKVYEAGKILPEVVVTADDPTRKLVEDVNARSNADFVNRVKDPNRTWIQDWEDKNKIATHKLSWAEDGGKAIVYPNVQNINGKLHDFTDPKYNHGEWDALDSAIERGDTLLMTPKQAKMYTENYKKYYPKGKTFDCGKSLPKYDDGTSDKTYLPEYEYEATVTPQGTSVEKHKRITNEEDWQKYWGDVGAGYVNKAQEEAAPYVLNGMSMLTGNPIGAFAGIAGGVVGEDIGAHWGPTGRTIGGLVGGIMSDNLINFHGAFNPGLFKTKSDLKYPVSAKVSNKASLAENATNMTPEQWTAAQDTAIARGDIAEAQRLRDLHFRTYAPDSKIVDVEGNPRHVYHGGAKNITRFLNPNEFDASIKLNNYYKNGRNRVGIYTSDWKSYAEQYARGYKKKNRNIYDLYANIENPRYVSYWESQLNRLRNLNPFRKKDFLNPSIIRPEHKEELLKGYGGVKWDIENVVFDGKQLKSADAVTYDDKGVRIPLGKRDNFNTNDIRYGLIPLLLGGTTAGYWLKDDSGYDKGKSIYINPANKGKFNATKKRTGKTTEQLAHSKNPLTRKRAIFALNSRKFKH